MSKQTPDHEFLLRVYRDLRAFKSQSPTLMLTDLCEAWTGAGRPAAAFAPAVSHFVQQGFATWTRVDDEFVIELTQLGVQRTWQLHSPGVAARQILKGIAARMRTRANVAAA